MGLSERLFGLDPSLEDAVWEWLSFAAVYWLNFWRLAFTYVLAKLWFLVSVGGFVPFLRAAIHHEAQGQIRLSDPYRSEQGIAPAYRPYSPERLRGWLRRR